MRLPFQFSTACASQCVSISRNCVRRVARMMNEQAGLPSRSLRAPTQWRLIRPPSFYSGVAAFALRCAPSEGWRRGELNPCPRRYPRKHLHVYPTTNSEEPSHAPAHCRLPSVHEIDSRTGAVAPPIRQPAVHVFAASRRYCENVAVN